MQGKRYDVDLKEKVIAEMMETNKVSPIAKKYGIKVTTAYGWLVQRGLKISTSKRKSDAEIDRAAKVLRESGNVYEKYQKPMRKSYTRKAPIETTAKPVVALVGHADDIIKALKGLL